jgi:hypothetical protein
MTYNHELKIPCDLNFIVSNVKKGKSVETAIDGRASAGSITFFMFSDNSFPNTGSCFFYKIKHNVLNIAGFSKYLLN